MAFPLVACLLVIGVVAVIIGAVTASSVAFGVAALTSAVAVYVLWRTTKKAVERPFVTEPPIESPPDWDRPLRDPRSMQPEVADRDISVVVIDRYDDLVAAEILPSLETLSVEQLQSVIRHEQGGLGRTAVIERAKMLIDLTKLPENDVVVNNDVAPQAPRRETAAERAERERPPMRRTTGTRNNPVRSKNRPRRGPTMGL
jgi:hypothetical protein